MGFKDYKIRDGVHIPSDKFRENWNAIFGKKKKEKDPHLERKTYSRRKESNITDT